MYECSNGGNFVLWRLLEDNQSFVTYYNVQHLYAVYNVHATLYFGAVFAERALGYS